MAIDGSDILSSLQSPLSATLSESRKGLSSTYAQVQQMVRRALPALALVMTGGLLTNSPITCSVPASSSVATATANTDHLLLYCGGQTMTYTNFLYLVWIECVVLILPSFLYMSTVGQHLYAAVYDIEHLMKKIVACMEKKMEDQAALRMAQLWAPPYNTGEADPNQQRPPLSPLPNREVRRLSTDHKVKHDESMYELSAKTGQAWTVAQEEKDRETDRTPLIAVKDIDEKPVPTSVGAMMRDPRVTDTFDRIIDYYAPSWADEWKSTASQLSASPRGCFRRCTTWYSLFWWTTVFQIVFSATTLIVMALWPPLHPNYLHFQLQSTPYQFSCTGAPLTSVAMVDGSLVSTTIAVDTVCIWRYPTLFYILYVVNCLLVTTFLLASVGKFCHMFHGRWFCLNSNLVSDDGSLLLYSLLFYHPQVMTPRAKLAAYYQYYLAFRDKRQLAERRQKEEKEQAKARSSSTGTAYESPFTPNTTRSSILSQSTVLLPVVPLIIAGVSRDHSCWCEPTPSE